MSDPRTENARAFHVAADGKVDGVELAYLPVPSAKYALVRAEFIPEAAAAGATVATCAVFDKDNVQTGENVYLAWPWQKWPALEGWGLPGNPNGQHMITNGYKPPALGPLEIFVGTAGNPPVPISDIIGGIGLPINRHVCYRFTWKERVGGGGTEKETLPEDEPKMAVGLLADKCRWWLEESIRQDEAGNKARAEAIRYSLIKLDGGLFYRLEFALKAGSPQG
jgi:hypothetical protein